nr:MAG TPA: lysozyme [Caudoviricetes sp.]
MKSISFPDMLTSSKTLTVNDLEATKQNLFLLLNSEKGELFGDPYFGIKLKRYTFEPNNFILKDILIDDIYTQSALFMPQLKINRNDIKLTTDQTKGKLTGRIKATNLVDYSKTDYSLVLYDEDNQQ